MSKFSTGRIFSRATSDDPESLANLGISREFTPRLVAELSKQGGEHMREMYKNLFSIFELEGPDGLYATLLTYINRKGLLPEAVAAVNDGDTGEFVQAVICSLEATLFELYEKGALKRILLVDELPALASQDLLKLMARVESRQPESEPVAEAAVVPLAPQINPIDQCVADFRSMGSAEFQNTWIRNTKRRGTYERAIELGRI